MERKIKSSSIPLANFDPQIVVKLHKNVETEAANWFIDKLQMDRKFGGGNLIVKSVINEKKEKTMLYLSAAPDKLLLGAELFDLKKKYNDGYYRDFNIDDLENFQGAEDISSFFTNTEKIKIIYRYLCALRAQQSDTHIPGYPNAKLYPGKSLLRKFKSAGIIEHVYPLHDVEKLKFLKTSWDWKSFFRQLPMDDIRAYFGEKLALYFSFLIVYTYALIAPAIIGIIYLITSWNNIYREAIFAVFNLIWTTIFLEFWKRFCSELTFKWGTLNEVVETEEPRPSFHGVLGTNPVTGHPEPVYPKWKRQLRFYGVTVPVILLCLLIAFEAMLLYFQMQDWANLLYEKDPSYLNYANMMCFPSIVYAVAVTIMNTLYNILIKKLNDYENHRLQSSYENHLIVKMVSFNFVNCFMSLFYMGFYLQDVTLLRSDLVALLITQQVIGQLQESALPFLILKFWTKKVDKDAGKGEKWEEEGLPQELIQQAYDEASLEKYLGTLDDYLELFLQFGYVFLFSSVYPLAAFWALLNNIFELRIDSFKMCCVFRRPFPLSASSIGAWQMMFELMGKIAVMTNCIIIGLNPQVQKLVPGHQTPVQLVVIVVILEHIILAARSFLTYLIPDLPRWIEIEVYKERYEAKKALEKVKIQNAMKRKHEQQATS
ncbi:Hypothetical predicted protein [Octopus vulgaris]|uniref:Uncharacterized protein n=2 Tax=Octopus TaxID=6643 RepID=A0AA36F3L6_OCTVU|nr:anoctamin-10 [Octopus sinensis]XP_029636375.1 anoctamin-10 [Octopus sinensis]XP_036358801.1 anoctamin-10 [Octopus sinensis]XP_036358802.1 anoctamin-10 [Octopus sinensis]XP_036358803.1 anoctamin-10 [Octopus sinensis]CAI9723214.1 Hypothetical predicted protein [Octopus vulgaris]